MMHNFFSKHEVHCTLGPSPSQKAEAEFRRQCAAGGIKVIDVENGATKVSRHVMTSTVCHSRAAADHLIQELKHLASITGLQIVREKIKVPPAWGTDRVQEGEYFELHLNIRAFDLAKVPFDRTKWFVSQNNSKPLSNQVPLWMLTARSYDTDLGSFNEECRRSFEGFKLFIDPDEPLFVEKCIHDSNVELDKHWMQPGV